MQKDTKDRDNEGPVPPPGVPHQLNNPLPRRFRRLHRVWPDRDGNISYLLTMCVEGRTPVLDNAITFKRLASFLLNSSQRYHWFPRRFVIMPDHIHLIAHIGHDAVRLGQWIKALKAVVAGLEQRNEPPYVGRVPSRGVPSESVGRVPPHGVPVASEKPVVSGTKTAAVEGPVPPPGALTKLTRIKRSWRWQDGYHDHKFRTPESESRKWEYICLNPVRYELVKQPEQWPYAGEIFYDEAAGPRLVHGTPPLLETGMLIEEPQTEDNCETPPREGTRPST